MTATPSMTTKKTATTAVLAGIGIVAFAYVLLLVQGPADSAGWRHQTSVSEPAALTAPVQTRGSNSEGSALNGAADTTATRGRN